MQNFEAFLLALWFDAMAEHDFASGFVGALFKSEAAALFGLLQRPSGEDARYFGHILLGVAAIHTKGVKFHQFAAVVFIESVTLALGLIGLSLVPDPMPRLIVGLLGNAIGDIGVWSDAEPIVEIEEHGRTLRGRDQQVFKFAQGMRTNDVALVAGEQVA